MSNALELATKRLLNDRQVFPFLYDQATRRNVGLFEINEWTSLKEAFLKGDSNAILDKVLAREDELKRQAQNRPRQPGRNQYEYTVRLAAAFRDAINKAPSTVKFLFDTLESFGCLECPLRSMEDFGKVAEFEPVAKLRQFFLYKIGKASDRERNALKRVFREVDYLLDEGCDATDLGFFLRKLEDLKLLPEVIL